MGCTYGGIYSPIPLVLLKSSRLKNLEKGGQKQGLRRCRTKAAHCLWVTTKRCLPLWVKTMGGAPMLVQKYMIPSAAESEVRTATV